MTISIQIKRFSILPSHTNPIRCILYQHDPISRYPQTNPLRRYTLRRPYRRRHNLHLRAPITLLPLQRCPRRTPSIHQRRHTSWLPRNHHQKTTPPLHHPRTPLVPQRRNQHRLPQRKQCTHLGRMGRRQRRPRASLRLAMEIMGFARWFNNRPDHPADR